MALKKGNWGYNQYKFRRSYQNKHDQNMLD